MSENTFNKIFLFLMIFGCASFALFLGNCMVNGTEDIFSIQKIEKIDEDSYLVHAVDNHRFLSGVFSSPTEYKLIRSQEVWYDQRDDSIHVPIKMHGYQ